MAQEIVQYYIASILSSAVILLMSVYGTFGAFDPMHELNAKMTLLLYDIASLNEALYTVPEKATIYYQGILPAMQWKDPTTLTYKGAIIKSIQKVPRTSMYLAQVGYNYPIYDEWRLTYVSGLKYDTSTVYLSAANADDPATLLSAGQNLIDSGKAKWEVIGNLAINTPCNNKNRNDYEAYMCDGNIMLTKQSNQYFGQSTSEEIGPYDKEPIKDLIKEVYTAQGIDLKTMTTTLFPGYRLNNENKIICLQRYVNYYPGPENCYGDGTDLNTYCDTTMIVKSGATTIPCLVTNPNTGRQECSDPCKKKRIGVIEKTFEKIACCGINKEKTVACYNAMIMPNGYCGSKNGEIRPAILTADDIRATDSNNDYIIGAEELPIPNSDGCIDFREGWNLPNLAANIQGTDNWVNLYCYDLTELNPAATLQINRLGEDQKVYSYTSLTPNDMILAGVVSPVNYNYIKITKSDTTLNIKITAVPNRYLQTTECTGDSINKAIGGGFKSGKAECVEEKYTMNCDDIIINKQLCSDGKICCLTGGK